MACRNLPAEILIVLLEVQKILCTVQHDLLAGK